MTLRPYSITGRLILTLIVGIAALWVVAAIVSTAILRHELGESFDHALVETAHRLLPLAIDTIHDSDEPEGVHDVHDLARDHDRELVYQLRAIGGPVILRSAAAPRLSFDAPLRTGFFETPEFRIFTLLDPDAKLAIQVAEPRPYRQDAMVNSMMTLLLPLLLLVPLSAIGIWYAIHRGLRPLRTLQAEIAARDSANLSPLRIEGLPRELTPIAEALARLIDRLRTAFEAERNFAANSAHELRTPIAGALAQTQRLIETTSDASARSEARKVESTLRRLADLAEKLMQLARADAGMAAIADPVDVLPILRLVVEDCTSRSRPRREIVLEPLPGAERVSARINVDALAIVLRNLIDNAVAHSAEGTPITVTMARQGEIRIRNESSVVPPESLDRLRHRFERGATSSTGSGLGLAIVDTILAQVGGHLDLHSPVPGRADGFEAVVTLRPITASPDVDAASDRARPTG